MNAISQVTPVPFAGLPYNHLLFNDKREALMETALQILIVTLDHDSTASRSDEEVSDVIRPKRFFFGQLCIFRF